MKSVIASFKYYLQCMLSLSPVAISIFNKSAARDYEVRFLRLADELQNRKITAMEKEIVMLQQRLEESHKPQMMMMECLDSSIDYGRRADDFIKAAGLAEEYAAYRLSNPLHRKTSNETNKEASAV